MKKPTTAADRRHMGRVAALGCIICGNAAEVHHIRHRGAMGMKSKATDTIPLCPTHHRTGGHGVAIHAGQKTWEKNFGTEEELLKRTLAMINGDGHNIWAG